MQKITLVLLFLLGGAPLCAQDFQVLYRNGGELIVDAVRTPENTSEIDYDASPVEISAREALAKWVRVDSARWSGSRVTSIVRLSRNRMMALFHDGAQGHKSAIYRMISVDGGQSWNDPEIALKHNLYGFYDATAIYAPAPRDRGELILIASQRETGTAWIAHSHDNGRTWSYPEELPAFIRGDRFEIAAQRKHILLAYRDLCIELEDGTPNPSFDDLVLWEGELRELRGGYRPIKVRIAPQIGSGTISILPTGRNRVTFVASDRVYSYEPAELQRFVNNLK